jgi:hypothetical protein
VTCTLGQLLAGDRPGSRVEPGLYMDASGRRSNSPFASEGFAARSASRYYRPVRPHRRSCSSGFRQAAGRRSTRCRSGYGGNLAALLGAHGRSDPQHRPPASDRRVWRRVRARRLTHALCAPTGRPTRRAGLGSLSYLQLLPTFCWP